MSRHTAAWLAWSLGILWALLLALTFLLFALNLLHPGVEVDPLWIQSTVISVSYPALGLLLVSRHPEHPIGWLFCAAGLVAGLEHFCNVYASYALLSQPGSLPGGQGSGVDQRLGVGAVHRSLCALGAAVSRRSAAF